MPDRPRLLILHNLPLEYYPPLINLLRDFVHRGKFELIVLAAPTPAEMTPISLPGCRILRYPGRRGQRFRALRDQLAFTCLAAREILSLRPEAILSFEPHSAFPLLIWRFALKNKCPLFVHHHEFYTESDFASSGHRTIRTLFRLEKRHVLPHASWISQTNEDRRSLFLEENPACDPSRVHVLPNLPPDSWGSHSALRIRQEGSPIRLLYVGSASFDDTYIREIADWVALFPGKLELSIFSRHLPEDVRRFLSSHESPNISFHPEGINYDKLPDELPRHDAGLVLYRARSRNFLFNETNKLFEYRACGLAVWYPQQMKSIERLREQTGDSALLPLSFESLPGTIPNLEACPESELCHRRAGEVLARLHDKLISETAS